ncbi:MAG: DNA-directed RNA polymerase subunit beta [Chloroflexi bacterium CFX6]|nr:DNA-directed RNA polymerase subunit beta [Chloroflexi bacterium CFX6]
MAKTSQVLEPTTTTAAPEPPAVRTERIAVPLVQRRNYARIPNHQATPALIVVQLEAFEWFKREGIAELFREVSPIVSFNKNLELHFLGHRFEAPKYSVADCREMDMTFSAPLWVTVRLVNRTTGEIQEQEVFMGDFPMMTDNATFVINGAERVVVSQLIRSPGVYFSVEEDRTTGRALAQAKLIPNRGAWLEFETSKRDVISVKVDRKRKFPVTTLLRAIGYATDEDLLGLFQHVDTDDDHPYIATTLEKDPTSGEEDALLDIYRKLRPGDPPTVEGARTFLTGLLFNERRYDLGRVGRYKLDRKLHLDPVTGQSVDGILQMPRPHMLTREDLYRVVQHMIRINTNQAHEDDIDHLGNRRVKTVGELIQNQLRVGLLRMERVVRERMSTRDPNEITPLGLINIRPVVAATREFFGGSQLSQFMEQTNPLGELTHKRRLSALGPGGLRRERAGFDVRDVHHSHYGRICPIETPEGPNIGLIGSLATYARVNDYGFIETPYRAARSRVAGTAEALLGRMVREDVVDAKGKVVVPAGTRLDAALAKKVAALGLTDVPVKPFVTGAIEHLTADLEDHYAIAQANSPLNEHGEFVEDQVTVRREERFELARPERVDFIDVDPKQIVSVSTSLIPFLEHDDANRALMGSNMLRQGVPLLRPESPVVGTGMEFPVAVDSGHVVIAEKAGEVISVTGDRILVREDDGGVRVYSLDKFVRSNASTTIDQRPVVFKGEQIEAGRVLADSSSTEHGELALGQNLLVAFLSWEGGNYEDAILLSQGVVRDDKFTSVHIEKHEVEARDTKLGPEEITRDIPNVGDDALRDLDEHGVIRVGAEVAPGDILVGKITPKGETDLTPEEKLLRAIFGEKAREVKDSSLRLPHGERGKVVSVRAFSRDDAIELAAGVERMVRVMVAQQRKVTEGDKMAGRHGNKGVISQVVPLEDMPFLEDGTPVEIILNPLGVPGRMNIGQILETHLGWAASRLGFKTMTPVFDGASEDDIAGDLARAWLIDRGWRATTDRAWQWAVAEGVDTSALRDEGEVNRLYLQSRRPDVDEERLWADDGFARRIALEQWLDDLGYASASIVDFDLQARSAVARVASSTAAQAACLQIWLADMQAGRPELADLDPTSQDLAELLRASREVTDRTGWPMPLSGKQRLYDGKTGEAFDQPVTVGIIYMMKLAHLVEDKVHARSTGPYSLVTQQPLGGKAQFGGQRFGEMEVWALEAYGAAHTLQEMLTIKSDDVNGRVKTYEAIVKGEEIQDPGAPESFRVLIKELQSLGLGVKVLDESGQPIVVGRDADEDRGTRLGFGLRLPPNRRVAEE